MECRRVGRRRDHRLPLSPAVPTSLHNWSKPGLELEPFLGWQRRICFCQPGNQKLTIVELVQLLRFREVLGRRFAPRPSSPTCARTHKVTRPSRHPILVPCKGLRTTIKSRWLEIVSTFGDKCPQHGSKNATNCSKNAHGIAFDGPGEDRLCLRWRVSRRLVIDLGPRCGL